MGASDRFVVVGGGVVAASVAYHLARRGASVIIVDGDHAGAATNAGAGIICPWTASLDDAMASSSDAVHGQMMPAPALVAAPAWSPSTMITDAPRRARW